MTTPDATLVQNIRALLDARRIQDQALAHYCGHQSPWLSKILRHGRGVTIHREDCRNVLRWQGEDSPRLLQVRWGAQPEARYRAGVLLRAFNRRELFKDISSALSSADVGVTDMNSRPVGNGDETEIRLALQVRTYEQLSELLTRLAAIRNVLEVGRLRDELPRK